MAAIVADGVEKSYGETAALRGVSLEIDAGSVLALVGPNGAGKTTLVRCLTGTTRPDAGAVALFGESPRALDKSRLGLLPQEFDPPGRLTARELLSYYAGLYDDARDPGAVLREVGIADAADTRYGNLSGGQRRRTLVGAAIVNDPAALFLDEPTTGIDPAGRRRVWETVEGLAAGGTTVLLTTHSMDEVERLADRVAVLRDGALVAAGPPGELIAEHAGDARVEVATDAADVDLPYPTERTDRGLAIEGIDPHEIGAVVEALDAAGVQYGALTWRAADLETAYLELTGEAPRREEP